MEAGGSRANFLLQLARLAEPTFIIEHQACDCGHVGVRNIAT